MHHPPLPPQDTPRYRVLGRLGVSGATELFLAVLPDLGDATKQVVIKRLWPQLRRDPDYLSVFLEEARLSLRLRHPKIVRAYEIGWQDGGYYLAVEHLDGESLENVLDAVASEGGLDLPLSLEVLTAVLAGLDHAHNLADQGTALGIVHRDVNPRNVFITGDGTVKLANFGVAQTVAAERRSQVGLPEGPLSYMAPELLRGVAVDRRADLYSVGVMLWEIAARRRLWAGFTEAEVRHWLREGKPAAPLPPGNGVPPELATVCARALAIDPDDRYATAAELQADLAQILTVSSLSRSQQLGAVVKRACVGRRPPYRVIPEPGSALAGPVPASLKTPSGPTARLPPRLPRSESSTQARRPDRVGPARQTTAPLEDDDDMATCVYRPPQRRRSSAWWLVGLVLLVAGGSLAVSDGQWLSPALPPVVVPPLPRPDVESMHLTPGARTAPRPAPSFGDSLMSRERRKSTIETAASSTPRRRRGSSAASARRGNAANEVLEALALGQQALSSGELMRADQFVRRALLFDPRNVEAVGTLAEIRFEQAQYKEALMLAERAVRLAPRNAGYLVLLGDVSFKLGLALDAVTAYERARAVKPDDPAIRVRLDRVGRPSGVAAD
jgi:eukaryotic-like serine/threonine-protein kinase